MLTYNPTIEIDSQLDLDTRSIDLAPVLEEHIRAEVNLGFSESIEEAVLSVIEEMLGDESASAMWDLATTYDTDAAQLESALRLGDHFIPSHDPASIAEWLAAEYGDDLSYETRRTLMAILVNQPSYIASIEEVTSVVNEQDIFGEFEERGWPTASPEAVTIDVTLPACWWALLDIDLRRHRDPFGRAIEQAGDMVEMDTPLAFHNDHRDITFEQDGYGVTVGLHSGQTSYWFSVSASHAEHGEVLFFEDGDIQDVEGGALKVTFSPEWAPAVRATAIEVVKKVGGVSKRVAATVVDEMNVLPIAEAERQRVLRLLLGVACGASPAHEVAELVADRDERLTMERAFDVSTLYSTVTGEPVASIDGVANQLAELIDRFGIEKSTGLPTHGGADPLRTARAIHKRVIDLEMSEVRRKVLEGANTQDDGTVLAFDGFPDDLGYLRTCDGDLVELMEVVARNYGPDIFWSGSLRRGEAGHRMTVTISEVYLKASGEDAASEAATLLRAWGAEVEMDGRRLTARWS